MMLADASNLAIGLWLSGCLIAIVLSAIYSGSETGVYSLNRTRLRIDAHDGKRDALRLQKLMRDKTGLLFTTLVGTNVANYLAPLCLTVVFVNTLDAATQQDRERLAELYATLILTPTVFIFGEIVPKNVFHLGADALMRRFSRFIQFTHWLCRLTGLQIVQRGITRTVSAILGRGQGHGLAVPARADVYHILRESAAEGTLTTAQSTMVERIHHLNTIRIRDVMVPLKSVVMADSEQTRADLEPRLAKTRYSRMPVYKVDRRHVIGAVHLLDVLDAKSDTTVSELMRPTTNVPANVTIIEALETLQSEYARMAIVVNDVGDCIGIATVKDIVEEIVGDLTAF